MPPPRPPRRRCGRRRRSATTAGTTNPPTSGSSRGWLFARRRPFKRPGPEHGDQAVPLGDEILLLVFSALSDAGDLVRCAAACRRWRRLVSSEAAFICRRETPRCDRFVRRLALGAFVHGSRGGGGDGFVPFCSPGLSLADGGAPGSSCRVVASRNGRVVLDLRRARSACVLRLCVCDPMTSAADLLPPLTGKDRPGPYACALLTADDGLHLYDTCAAGSTATSPSSYRVLLLYNHRSYTALRRYSSDDGFWGPEVQVAGARIARGRQLGVKAHATLVRGGVVCWYGLGIAVNLATLHASNPPSTYAVEAFHSPPRRALVHLSGVDRLLGLMPDGRLCVLESKAADDTMRAYVVVYTDVVRDGGVSGRKELRWTLRAAPMGLRGVRLRWFCEKSGVALFTARNTGGKMQVYAVDVETKQVGRVDWPGDDGAGDGDMDVCGYEMDRVAMLAELDRSTVLHLAPRQL